MWRVGGKAQALCNKAQENQTLRQENMKGHVELNVTQSIFPRKIMLPEAIERKVIKSLVEFYHEISESDSTKSSNYFLTILNPNFILGKKFTNKWLNGTQTEILYDSAVNAKLQLKMQN